MLLDGSHKCLERFQSALRGLCECGLPEQVMMMAAGAFLVVDQEFKEHAGLQFLHANSPSLCPRSRNQSKAEESEALSSGGCGEIAERHTRHTSRKAGTAIQIADATTSHAYNHLCECRYACKYLSVRIGLSVCPYVCAGVHKIYYVVICECD